MANQGTTKYGRKNIIFIQMQYKKCHSINFIVCNKHRIKSILKKMCIKRSCSPCSSSPPSARCPFGTRSWTTHGRSMPTRSPTWPGSPWTPTKKWRTSTKTRTSHKPLTCLETRSPFIWNGRQKYFGWQLIGCQHFWPTGNWSNDKTHDLHQNERLSIRSIVSWRIALALSSSQAPI